VIRVGIAGWDYPDWDGAVYPVGSRLDRLAWISRFVDLIEINSTFYRPAAPRTAAGWLRRTARRDGFAFSAKAHRAWSHEPLGDAAATVRPTLDGLAPLYEAGRLVALLVQFPQSFHHTPEALERLARLCDAAAGWPLVVEVRHVSWGDPAASAWLAGRGLSVCVVDQPRVGRATLGPDPRVTGRLAYLRLHGRNARDWFRPDAGRDARYDYLYAPREIETLAGTARTLAATAEELVVVQNNHFRGQALVNALQMMGHLHGARPAAPEALVRAYPDLAQQVRPLREGLF